MTIDEMRIPKCFFRGEFALKMVKATLSINKVMLQYLEINAV